MTEEEIGMRLGVMRTIAQYTRFGDAGQFDKFADQFTDKGVLQTAFRSSEGREQILEFVGEIGVRFSRPAGFLPARHHVASIHVEPVDAEHAKASSYFLLVAGTGPDHWGRYQDRLEKSGDLWLFTHRRVYVEGSLPSSPVADQVESS